MEEFKDVWAQALAVENIRGRLSDFCIEPMAIVELKCFQAIEIIKEILEDDTLKDVDCFLKIEEIICCLEDLGLSCGTRHNFG